MKTKKPAKSGLLIHVLDAIVMMGSGSKPVCFASIRF